MALDAQQRRAVGRALWSYSGMKQPDFAARVGMDYNRFRASLNDDAKTPITTDELLVMCEALGLSPTLAIEGLQPAEQTLSERLEELRAQQVEDSIRLAQLEEAVRALTARDRREREAGGAAR